MTLALRRREKKTDLNNKWLQPSPRLSPEKLASKKDRKLQNTMMTGNFFSVLLFLKNLLQSSGLRRTTFESMLPWDGPTLEWRHLLSGRLFQMRNFHLIYLSLSRTLTLDFLIQQQRRKEGMSESGRESLKKLQTKIFRCRLVIRNFKKSDELQKLVEIWLLKKRRLESVKAQGFSLLLKSKVIQSGTKISWLVLFTFY